MKRPSPKSSRANAADDARLWTQDQARAAAPYLASILRSVREHNLEIRFAEQALARMSRQPGRPTRQELITQEDTRRSLELQRRLLAEAADELESIGGIPVDPAQGLLLLPFAHQDRLAWFIFDLFDPNPIRWWRYSEDPEDHRRPLTPAQSGLIEVSA